MSGVDWESEVRRVKAQADALAKQQQQAEGARVIERQREAQRITETAQRMEAEQRALIERKLAEFERATGIVQSLEEINRTTTFWQGRGKVDVTKSVSSDGKTGIADYSLQAKYLDSVSPKTEDVYRRKYVWPHREKEIEIGMGSGTVYEWTKLVPGEWTREYVGRKIIGVLQNEMTASMRISVSYDSDTDTYNYGFGRYGYYEGISLPAPELHTARGIIKRNLVDQLVSISSHGTIAQIEQAAQADMKEIKRSIGRRI